MGHIEIPCHLIGCNGNTASHLYHLNDLHNLYNLNLSLKRQQKTPHKRHRKTIISKTVKGMRVIKRLRNYSRLKEQVHMKHNSELDHFAKKRYLKQLKKLGWDLRMRVVFPCWLPVFHSGTVVTEESILVCRKYRLKY